MKWSNYQQQIFDFSDMKRESENGVVEAVAGSGKTTTLVEFADRAKGSVLVVAFNRHIAKELGSKLNGNPNAEARTMHSLGRAAFGRYLGSSVKLAVENRKYWDLGRQWVDEHLTDLNSDQKFQAGKALSDIHSMMRLNLIEPDDEQAIFQVAAHHGIEQGVWFDGIPWMFNHGNELAVKTGLIDFTDMIYLPSAYDCPMPKSMWVLVDEAQDLNKAQLELALKCKNDFGRLMFVGDEKQAIYGFAGADAASFQNIKMRTSATELPLSICYRCPTSHLDIIRHLVPQIEAREGAPEGVVRRASYDKLSDELKGGDLILCRINAPLVKLCINLIKNRVPAQVRGRDIGKSMNVLIRKVGKMPGFSYSSFLQFLEIENLKKMDFFAQKQASEGTVEAWRDKMECIEVCYVESDANSIQELCSYIEGLFDDTPRMIYLSSVHRAKGLENDRVFILRPDKLPLEWKDQKDWERQQELNLQYVAHTRAKKELIYIDDPSHEAGGGTRYMGQAGN